MLSIASRFLLRQGRGITGTSARALSTSIAEHKHFEPSEWFTDVEDSSVRNELNKIREVENDMLSSFATREAEIDWSHWKSEITYPGLVDELKAMHDSSPVPSIEEEAKKAYKEIENAFVPVLKEFETLSKDVEAETAKLEARLKEVTFLKENLENLTVDEFLEKYPSVKKSIEDDIANNRWFVPE